MVVFDSKKGARALTALQIAALCLVHGVLGVAAYRQFSSGGRVRNNRIAMGFAAKSIIIILYELSTDHFQRLSRFRSLKAYMILGFMELVFWVAVPVLMVMAWIKDKWSGLTATLGGVIVGLGCAVAILYLPIAFISFQRWRRARDGTKDPSPSGGDMELAKK